MGYFKLGKMTLKSLFKRPETIRYPYETKPPVDGSEGSCRERHRRMYALWHLRQALPNGLHHGG